MFRLIKLAMYAMIGYVLYELYQGMTQQQGGRSFDQSSGGTFGGGGGGSYGAFTGGGEGMLDTAADNTGGEMPHRVGRGVIRSGA
jgi:hypothetical protein